MGIVINNNIAAINAWRQLSSSNNQLAKSLEKLSSGLQINRGGDNPAGLVISEKLGAQATGLKQAMANTGDAVSVIQVAEGGLQEVHSILNSMRALAVHAANAGANDSDSTAADQQQVDNAIDAITRIANTTKFLGKFLLNGGAGNTGTINSASAVSAISVSTALTTGFLMYNISSAATRSSWSTLGNDWSANGTMVANDTVTINGIAIALSICDTRTTVLSKINARSSDTGVNVSGAANAIGFYANSFGSKFALNLSASTSGVFGTGTLIVAGVYTIGADIVGSINGSVATGTGLSLIAGSTSGWSGTKITFTSAGNTTNATTSPSTNVSVTKSALTFNIGANATANELITFSVNDMRATALGTSGNGFLDNATNGIKTGQGNALATNASGAVTIIDDAIQNVSDERSKLGAYQKNAIETMQNSLGAAMENIQASQSRIKDLDMAAEMMAFTRNQILVQAGTAMLAQANLIPQSALQLLR